MSLEVQENVCLASYTTLGIGGLARFFAEIRSESALIEALAFAKQNHLRLSILGGGSNLLVSNVGFPGLVLHLTLEFPVEISSNRNHVDVHAPAGLEWDALVLQTCNLGLSGMECLAGIPGLTGASPIQNIGAYGQEVAQSISGVRALDLQTRTFTQISSENCGFSYRSSIFNSSARGRYIVTAVDFRLLREGKPNTSYADLKGRFAGQQPTPAEVYHAVREIRRIKGMLLVAGDPDCRSAGSFFKNPVVSIQTFEKLAHALELQPSQIPHWPSSDGGGKSVKLAAAWLIERAGFEKGYVLGQAGLSSRHTLALINRGKATYADIVLLRDRIRAEVVSRFSITLEQEPIEFSADSSL